MGNQVSSEGLEGGSRDVRRQEAVTEVRRKQLRLPLNATKSKPEDWPYIEVGASGPRLAV